MKKSPAYKDFAPSIIASKGGTSLSSGDYKNYKQAKWRILFITALFLFVYFIGAGRVIILSFSDYQRKFAGVFSEKHIEHRANITDRKGTLIATSLKIQSIYADPSKIIDLDEAIDAIYSILKKDMTRSTIYGKLKNPKKRFVWIKRKITPEMQYKINKLGIPGIFFKEEEQRFYPQGNSMAQVIGVGLLVTGLYFLSSRERIEEPDGLS